MSKKQTQKPSKATPKKSTSKSNRFVGSGSKDVGFGRPKGLR